MINSLVGSTWLAGVSQVDITPKGAIWLHGWGSRTKPSQGVAQRIFAKVLALRDHTGQAVVWVTVDLLGYSHDMVSVLTKRAQKRFGLGRSCMILNSSHNHSGPITDNLLHLYFQLPKREHKAIDLYTAWLMDRIIDSIGLALDDLAPAHLAFGQGLAGFAVNRRRARPGGRSLPGIVDQDVPVLSVCALGGALRAVVFGYACHTTTVENGKINGDYAGYAQQYLQGMYPNAIALFVAGCGGDANPLPRFHPGLVESYGRILAIAVHQVLSGNMRPIRGTLRTASAEVELAFEKPPTSRELGAMLFGRENIERRAVKHLLAILKRKGSLPRHCKYPVKVWQFGCDLKLIALAGEPVADYALRFKKEYGYENTWVSGYNDVLLAYIPSARVQREGGYEGGTGMMEYGLPGPFASDIEKRIARIVDELMEATHGNAHGTLWRHLRCRTSV